MNEYQMGVGSPGDFQFSDVPKPGPLHYLHTYRDLHGREHSVMLTQLMEGTNRFLRTLFDESFLARASISAGFHYPVRTQYATLHMQVRVNSGSVCADDGRGIDTQTLIETLQKDRNIYMRDDLAFRYDVTENIKVSLLAAAHDHEELNGAKVVREIQPLSYELGTQTESSRMNGGEGAAVTNEHEYIINLQPTRDSALQNFLYQKRAACAERLGMDPTYLYPFHVSVTGFFKGTEVAVAQVVELMRSTLEEELALQSEDAGPPVKVNHVLSTTDGYILLDVHAPVINTCAKKLSQKGTELGLRLRPKEVNHISLASGRDEPELQKEIQELYRDVDLVKDNATFDLVLSRVIRRSSFERLAQDGSHKFEKLVRIKVTREPEAVAEGGAEQQPGEAVPISDTRVQRPAVLEGSVPVAPLPPAD